jgi:aspartokinase-like uncharacterized kinase
VVVTRLTIVKLGGSHAFAPTLKSWLEAIAAAAGQVVVVPGGGPFADAVRAAQPRMGFDDRTAHAMAQLAMAQFARALAGIGGHLGLLVAASRGAIGGALGSGKIPVWAPQDMLRDAADVPPSWSVTSDSLALWLAALLRAPQVLLVKQRQALPGAGPAALAGDGLVDAAFPEFASRYVGAIFIAGPAERPLGGLDVHHLPGTPVRALA